MEDRNEVPPPHPDCRLGRGYADISGRTGEECKQAAREVRTEDPISHDEYVYLLRTRAVHDVTPFSPAKIGAQGRKDVLKQTFPASTMMEGHAQLGRS